MKLAYREMPYVTSLGNGMITSLCRLFRDFLKNGQRGMERDRRDGTGPDERNGMGRDWTEGGTWQRGTKQHRGTETISKQTISINLKDNLNL